MSSSINFRNTWSWITVEPVEFLYVLMFTLSSVVRDNLFLDKVCLLDFDYPEDACYNLTHGQEVNKNISDTVQARVTDLEVLDGIFVAIPALVFSLFVGTYVHIFACRNSSYQKDQKFTTYFFSLFFENCRGMVRHTWSESCSHLAIYWQHFVISHLHCQFLLVRRVF